MKYSVESQRPSLSRGFTMFELMIAVAVAAVLAALAGPNFSDFIERQRIKSEAQRLVKALSTARMSSLSNQLARSTVCWNSGAGDVNYNYTPKNSAPQTVALASNGIAVFEGDLTDGFGDLLSVNELVGEQTSFVASEADGCFGFNAQGSLDQTDSNEVTFAMCREAGDAEDALIVTVSRSGRVFTSESQNTGDCNG